MAANEVVIYSRPTMGSPAEIIVTSDSTTVTYIAKEKGCPVGSSLALTCYTPVRVLLGPGEQVRAVSGGTPNLTVYPLTPGFWAVPVV